MTIEKPSAATALPVRAGTGPDEARSVAQEFESVFLGQMLREMTSGLSGPGPLAGAEANPFAAMLQDEYAKLVARSGGIGIADAVLRELTKTQETAHDGV